MPVAATNETPAVATSAMPVEEINDTPDVATSAMPVEQSNDTGVAPNNEMSITVPPHLLTVAPGTTNLTVQINNYEPFPLKAHVKFNGIEIESVWSGSQHHQFDGTDQLLRGPSLQGPRQVQ